MTNNTNIVRLIRLFIALIGLSSCRTHKSESLENASTLYEASENVFQTVLPSEQFLADIDKSRFEIYYRGLREEILPRPESVASPNSLYRLLRSARLAGRPSEELMNLAHRMSLLKLNSQTNKWRSLVLIELARDAVSRQRLDLADYYLVILDEDKSSSIKAQALEIKGTLAFLRKDFDNAIQIWSKALKLDEQNKALRINLGFLLLRTGNADLTIVILEPIKDNWLALSGLLIAYRLSNQTKLAADSCDILEKRHKFYGPGLINCALFFQQNIGDAEKALVLLNQALKVETRPEVSEYAYLLKTELVAQPDKPAVTEKIDQED